MTRLHGGDRLLVVIERVSNSFALDLMQQTVVLEFMLHDLCVVRRVAGGACFSISSSCLPFQGLNEQKLVIRPSYVV